MNQKQAYDYGFSNGYSIAKSNLTNLPENPTNEEYEKFVNDMLETESEHFRQFSPFEFYAKEFNESRNPDSTWRKYETGVYYGIMKKIKEFKKENK